MPFLCMPACQGACTHNFQFSWLISLSQIKKALNILIFLRLSPQGHRFPHQELVDFYIYSCLLKIFRGKGD